MKRNTIGIVAISVGIIVCALGIYIPSKLGIVIQEISAIVIFATVYYFSRVWKQKNRIVSNILKLLAIFFLIAVSISLIATIKMLFSA